MVMLKQWNTGRLPRNPSGGSGGNAGGTLRDVGKKVVVGQRHALGFPGRAGSEHQHGFVRAPGASSPSFLIMNPAVREF